MPRKLGPLFGHVLATREPTAAPSPPIGAAGGDLTGTYPNPSVTPAAKSKWTVSGTTLTPTDATKSVLVQAGMVAVQNGTGNPVRTRVYTHGSNFNTYISNNIDITGGFQDDATRPSWVVNLGSTGADQIVIRRAPPGSVTLANPLILDASGNLTIAGATATKASGTTWANPSDPRLKDDIAPYPRGLADVLPLEPITYRLKTDGTRCIGFDASEVQKIFPECVAETQAILPGDTESTDGILSFDMHPILVTLVNAVKELAARVAALEARCPE